MITRNIQKAAMFGLEGEPLRKQSGELFLARLQRLTFRLVEGHQAIRRLNSKGAMFGLDARIALAIFGALSVITGASLYSAIKHARVIQTVSQLKEVSKAIESFYLDTGTLPLQINDNSFRTSELLVNYQNLPGWKGPYIDKAIVSSGHISNVSREWGYTYLKIGSISESWGAVNTATKPCVTDCYLWIEAIGLGSNDDEIEPYLLKGADEHVDGVADQLNGKIRYASGSGNHLQMLIMPLPFTQ